MPRIPASQLKAEFGTRMQHFREALGHATRASFARFIDVDQNAYSAWERGERFPEVANLLKLKEVTGVTSDYLLFGDASGLPMDLRRVLFSSTRLIASAS